jgi:lipopolysaccharide export system permease protein
MGSIGRYIFSTTLAAFVLVCVTLTLLMWITQAMRDFDLMTDQGQNFLTFVGITGLLIPLLVLIIAPIAFMVAMTHVLSKLGNDSELIVMNGAGMSPWHIFRPFLAVALLITLLLVALAFYLSPKSLRALRDWVTEVRGDLVNNVVQPGRFIAINSGRLTFHIRERAPNGELLGIFIDDQRDPKERATVLAEEGQVSKNDRGTYLLLARGSVQRQQTANGSTNIVLFDNYAFDLSQLASKPGVTKYSVRESYIWELTKPDRDNDSEARAELHDRIIAPFYPIAIAVVTFACLGAPRTTRQGRALSLVAAVGSVSLMRGLGFFGVILGSKVPIALVIPYLSLFAACALGFWTVSRGATIELPAILSDTISVFAARLAKVLSR